MTITINRDRVRNNNQNNLAEVKVHDGESIEAALRRFKKEVMKAGIILEVKKRTHYESKRQRKKRKKAECKRRAVFNAQIKLSGEPHPSAKKDDRNKDRKPGGFKGGRDSNS